MISYDCHCECKQVPYWHFVWEKYPPNAGKVMIYAENGHFIAWRYVLDDYDADDPDTYDYNRFPNSANSSGDR